MEFLQIVALAVVALLLIIKLSGEFLHFLPKSWEFRVVQGLPYYLIVALSSIILGAAYLMRSGSSTNSYIALLSIFILLPVVIMLWNSSPLGKRLTSGSSHNYETTVAQMTGNAELGSLKGKFGRTISPLRPSGVAEFDDRRVDVITEGMMVSAGEWVKCVEVRAGKVIVRPAEKPPLSDLENADFS
jgi:membrane-bound ClpP family serine protease